MLSFLNRLLKHQGNCAKTTSVLLELLHVNVTKTTIKRELERHPDFPSLLSISDILNNYGVQNVSFSSSTENIGQTSPPFIAQVNGTEHQRFFTVIRNNDNHVIEFLNPLSGIWQHVEQKTFIKEWSPGVLLLPEATDTAGEINYQKNRRAEVIENIGKYFSFLSIPLLTVVISFYTISQGGIKTTFPVLFTVINLIGSFLGTLLVWYEIDAYNPALKQICSLGKKTNCSAILQSGASKIMGISWSSIGFIYFFGGLLALLFIGQTNTPVLLFLTLANLVALPYIFYSIYYQWRIAKQWCVLCLGVQALLLLQFIIILRTGWYSQLDITEISTVLFPVALAFIIPAIAAAILIPALRSNKENRMINLQYQRFKHDPIIFEALLARQKKVPADTNPDLGIRLGNPHGKQKIIKVCNPYCRPCAESHVILESLLQNNPDIELQIIFITSNNELDRGRFPVRHFLAIDQLHSKAVAEEALNEWYLQPQIEYVEFAGKFPITVELDTQNGKIDAMRQWCVKAEVRHTPTFFVNGYQLPGEYNIRDLKYYFFN